MPLSPTIRQRFWPPKRAMIERMTLAALLADARQQLAAGGIADAALDVRLLIEAATGATLIEAIRAPDQAVDDDDARRLASYIARRLAGEPVHRILGHREFHGIDLALSDDTLEPRDDTEAVVELALETVGRDRQRELSILDLGTGTGAIALALLTELPKARATATDIAKGATETARANAARAGLSDRFDAVCCDWFVGVEGRFDLIVSNPPYIPSAEIDGLAREVRRFDPPRALDGGRDGLDAYRAIASGAMAHLADRGTVVVEIGS